ncbi:MAG TPA: hypothetical protein VFM51_01635 [Solirubrobacterales bacterium]|nr:hypothetical protein [Solirubrobacterales bacterium]
MARSPEGNDDAMPDQHLVRALDHPVRVAFLKLLAERGSIGAPEALSSLDMDDIALGNVAYHAWVLEHLELIETAEDTGPWGTRFRATSKGELALMALGFPT